MWLTLAAIRRPVWVFMLMIAAMVLGFLALRSLPVEQNPEIEFPFITIQTPYPGASPQEIETLVSKPIEDAVTTVNGIRSIQSTSLEGLSIVAIEFELGVDQDAALNDVKSKTDEIVGTLPTDAEKPVVSKLNIAGEPILYIAVESDKLTALELRDTIDERIKDRLARVPGVAEVRVSGGQTREIRVAVDRDRLLSYGIGITDTLNAIAGASVNIPGGRITEGQSETSVRVQGEFESVDELRQLDIPVSDRMNPGVPPAIVRLSDIATITDGPAERTEISRVNGRDAVIMTIQKTREGNTVAITEAVKAELDQLSKDFPITFTITREAAKYVKESLHELNIALFVGIFGVIGIVYLFLHNFRGTLIVALAIPTCLFAAFAAIGAFGFTLNIMTMLGLSLAVGILVDDAIVVLENTYRHLQMGEDPETAAINGRMEIGLAAVSITMVDVVIFLPVALMGGITGQFFRPFALTVATATLFSLFVSFTLTPMLASRWYRKGENLEDKHGFAKWFDNRFHKFADGYRNLLDKALNRRWLVFMGGWAFLFGVFMMIGGSFAPNLGSAIGMGFGLAQTAVIVAVVIFIISVLFKKRNGRILIGGALFGAAMIAFTALGYTLTQFKGGPIFNFSFAPATDSGLVSVNVTMPPGSSLDKTLAVVERIEGIARQIPDVEYVTSTVGSQTSGIGTRSSGSQYAQLQVTLKDKQSLEDTLKFWSKTDNLRKRHQTSVLTDLQQRVGKIPDAQIVMSAQSGFGFGAPVQVGIKSANPDLVAPAAEKAMEALSKVEGIVNLELSSKPGKPELIVRPDRIKLADNDLSVRTLGAVTRVFYEGNVDAKFREQGREYDIRINLADEVRQNIDALASVPIAFRQGNPVFLGQVADIVESVSTDKVERKDRQRQIVVSANLLPGFIIGTMGPQIDKALEEANLGENVTFAQLGENETQQREQPYIGMAFGLGLILVFLVLASLFNNVLYPFVIQLAQPQALVGAFLGLMLVGKAFDIVAVIGVIMLIGLVGKNAILLVDYANTLRARGEDRHRALLDSGYARLRPIMMTTLALILAMVPIALAFGRGSEFRQSLGIVIIGGLSLSTLLTLFVIPCSYTIFDDLSQSITKFRDRRLRHAPVQETAEVSSAEDR
jgi:HAE1 family hydrophobic/amphiphilic exporter-1